MYLESYKLFLQSFYGGTRKIEYNQGDVSSSISFLIYSCDPEQATLNPVALISSSVKWRGISH